MMEEIKIEIKEGENQEYYIYVDGHYFRWCRSYSDLAQAMGSLIKSRFKKNYEDVF